MAPTAKSPSRKESYSREGLEFVYPTTRTISKQLLL